MTEQDIIAILWKLGIHSTNLEDTIHGILSNDGPIEDWLELISFGAFKECYRLNKDYVIKFCACDNATLDELHILALAQEHGVEDFFLPTEHVALESTELVPYYLNGDDFIEYDSYIHEYRCADYFFSDILIQPYVDITGITKYVKSPLLTDVPIVDEYGQTVPEHFLLGCPITSTYWVQDAILYYGSDKFNELVRFLNEYKIHDLHSANIGWIKETKAQWKPVIFDWLS